MESYNFKAIEKKWQDKWEEAGVFHASTLKQTAKSLSIIQ